jgi:hypothetical protein
MKYQHHSFFTNGSLLLALNESRDVHSIGVKARPLELQTKSTFLKFRNTCPPSTEVQLVFELGAT